MARIIYKEGCEGQNTLESIEGIEIDLLNGQKALIYPKYSEEVMLPMENIKYYGQEPDTEIAALKETESECLTDALHDCGSPAAEFVHKFRSDKYGRFHLPTLIAAMELQDQKSDIDELLSIMGFPKDYALLGTKSENKKYIGNAVECGMARQLCEALYAACAI